MSHASCAIMIALGAGLITPAQAMARESSVESKSVLFNETFDAGLEHWVWEGPPGAVVEVREGSLLIDPREAQHRPPGTEGVNLWCRVPLAGDWELVFELEPIAPGPLDGDNCNLMFMFGYDQVDPALDLIEQSASRTGHYVWLHGREPALEAFREHHDVPVHPMAGYTVTYYRINHTRGETYKLVARRNPGFELLAEVPQTAEDQYDYRHTVRLRKRAGRLHLFADGDLILELDDLPPTAGDGHFGFRTWRAAVRLHQIQALDLTPAADD